MFEGLSLYEAYLVGAKRNPDATAIYYEGKKISFTELDKLICYYASILKNNLGLKKGDVVLVAQPNIPSSIILLYAINKIGAVSCLMHPLSPYSQMKEVMDNVDAKYAFLFEQRIAEDPEPYKAMSNKILVSRVEDYLPFFKKIGYHLFLNNKTRKKLKKDSAFKGFTYLKDLKPIDEKVNTETGWADEMAIILLSGSTTGDPKTICLSNTNFNFLAEQAPHHLCVDNLWEHKNEGMLSVLPSFHGFGLLWTIHAPLCIGFASVQIPKFTPKAVTKALHHFPLLAMAGVPNMYQRLVDYKPFSKCKNLKYCHVAWCGGDSLPPNLTEKFEDILHKNGSVDGRLFEGYGLTEAVTATILNTHELNCPGSIGHPGPDIEVKIVDENHNEVPLGEVGELAQRCQATMLGYYHDEKATREAVDEDGWLYTGDLCYMNEDGFVFFKQRKKRVVKVNGVAVFPSEVEKYIESLPNVKEASCVSVPFSKTGHALKAFVVAATNNEEELRDLIMKSCRANLIRYSVPVEIEFRKSLPHTMIGKVDFKVLQQEENEKRGIKE